MDRREAIGGALAALWCALLAGCGGGLGVGGTGSSGFDEQFVISAVLVDEQCLSSPPGVDYCPANVDDPGGGGKTVDAIVPDGEPVDCTAAEAAAGGVEANGPDSVGLAAACGFELPVTTEGFVDGVAIRVAIRVTGGDDRWRIGEAVYEGVDPAFVAELAVQPPDDVPPTGEFEVQVAILTYEPGAPEPPGEVDHLTESGATTVFVTREVTILTDPAPSPGSTPTPTPAATPTSTPARSPTPEPTRDSTPPTPVPTSAASPTPARTAAPASPTPARTAAPASPTPARTAAPASPTPARTAAPASPTPARTAAPASPTPRTDPAPTSRPVETPRATDAPRPSPTAVVDVTPRPIDEPAPTPADIGPTSTPAVDLEPTPARLVDASPTPRRTAADLRTTPGLGSDRGS